MKCINRTAEKEYATHHDTTHHTCDCCSALFSCAFRCRSIPNGHDSCGFLASSCSSFRFPYCFEISQL